MSVEISEELQSKLKRYAFLHRVIDEVDMNANEAVFEESRELLKAIVPEILEFVHLIAESGLLTFNSELGDIVVRGAVESGAIHLDGEEYDGQPSYCGYTLEQERMQDLVRRNKVETDAELVAQNIKLTSAVQSLLPLAEMLPEELRVNNKVWYEHAIASARACHGTASENKLATTPAEQPGGPLFTEAIEDLKGCKDKESIRFAIQKMVDGITANPATDPGCRFRVVDWPT